MKIKRLVNGKLYMRGGKLALAAASTTTPADPTDPIPDPPDPGNPPPANSTLTVNPERQVKFIYQRIGTSKTITISGTSTAPAGTHVEACVVDETSLAERSVWTPLALVDSNGNYSGTLTVPQGKWYKRRTRLSGTQITATEINSFGVGIGIVENGQSNMVGLKNNGAYYPLGDPAAYEYHLGGLRRVGNIRDDLPPNTLYGSGGYGSSTTGGTKSDGYVFVANLVAQATGLPVFVINMAVIGSTISSWIDDGTNNNWAKFVTAFQSIGGDAEIVIWYQGESNTSTAPATYSAQLAQLHQQYLTLTNRTTSTLKFGVISLGPVSIDSSYSGGNNTNFGRMRANQAAYANNTAGAFFVASAHDFGFTASSDGVHIGGVTQSHLGRRYAKSILAQLGFGTSAAGPRIVGATKSGNVVTVQIQHSGGTALQDGLGNAYGPSLKGFQFFDDGVEIPITGSMITGPTTFTLTLTSTPVGTCTLSYASQNAPHCLDTTDARSTYIPESVLLDNSPYYKTRDDNPLGCPLQPIAAFPVT
jgi:hypothetical protein